MSAAPPEKPYTILIVEDDSLSRVALNRLLTWMGLEVVVCETAEAGIEILKRQAVDRAVLDLNLPDQNGVEVLRMIGERGLPVKVAILSAAYDVGRFPRLSTLQADLILKKNRSTLGR